MTRNRGSTGRGSTATILWLLAGAWLCAFALAIPAHAQSGPTHGSVPPEPRQEAATPAPSSQPGFIATLGRWFEAGAAKFKSDMQGAQENLDRFGKEARDVAKDATTGLIALPNTRVLTGRERCVTAQNGAPDCLAAANNLCRGKGFQTGKLLDTQSEQKCPARMLLSGRSPNDIDCPPETFVTRAVCQ